MEVGAVKQAFNNEVILLKKNLNQAKIHVIHKLTRKAKTLTEKKAPEHLKEKLKRKAESAVNEVLIIKKIKAKDIAKFIITHQGELNSFLNRPVVDNDKACARLVLHKSLQEKYKFIRNRFGNVPIKDLFMSRLERRKLKKEAREQQKNKKKGKDKKASSSAGDWDVEDVEMNGDSKDLNRSDDEFGNETDQSESERNDESGEKNDSEDEDQANIELNTDKLENSQSYKENSDSEVIDDDDSNDDGEVEGNNVVDSNYDGDSNDDGEVEGNNDVNSNDDGEKEGNDDVDEDNNKTDEEAEIGKYIKLKPKKETKKLVEISRSPKSKNHAKMEIIEIDTPQPQRKVIDEKVKVKKQTDKKVKENKNKNLKEKLQNRKFKKDDDTQIIERKVVDPFFITATGGNYLSLAEPRQPDEVKDVHKQGNRQERRAALFGHVAKYKPRKDLQQNSFKSNKFDKQDNHGDNRKSGGFKNQNDRFNSGANFNDKYNSRNINLNDKSTKFNSGKFSNDEKKEEKLHPSWEAKRKMKTMSLLPAQGKKIVFNDN